MAAKDVAAYVGTLAAAARPDQPAGAVPGSTYWLTDGHELIGSVRLRHRLLPHLLHKGGHIGYDIRPSRRRLGCGTSLLHLALNKAGEMGMHRVLVSEAVIEHFGVPRLKEVIASASEGDVIARIFDALEQYASSKHFSDDATAVTVRW